MKIAVSSRFKSPGIICVFCIFFHDSFLPQISKLAKFMQTLMGVQDSLSLHESSVLYEGCQLVYSFCSVLADFSSCRRNGFSSHDHVPSSFTVNLTPIQDVLHLNQGLRWMPEWLGLIFRHLRSVWQQEMISKLLLQNWFFFATILFIFDEVKRHERKIKFKREEKVE